MERMGGGLVRRVPSIPWGWWDVRCNWWQVTIDHRDGLAAGVLSKNMRSHTRLWKLTRGEVQSVREVTMEDQSPTKDHM